MDDIVINDLLQKAQAGKGCELKSHFEKLSFDDTLKTMQAVTEASTKARKSDQSLPPVSIHTYRDDQQAAVHSSLQVRLIGQTGIFPPVWYNLLDSSITLETTNTQNVGERSIRCRDR